MRTKIFATAIGLGVLATAAAANACPYGGCNQPPPPDGQLIQQICNGFAADGGQCGGSPPMGILAGQATPGAPLTWTSFEATECYISFGPGDGSLYGQFPVTPNQAGSGYGAAGVTYYYGCQAADGTWLQQAVALQ